MITLKADFAWFLVGEKVSKISRQEKQSFEWWKREMWENENDDGSKIKGIALGTRSQNNMVKVPPLDLTQSHQMTSLGRWLGILMGPYLHQFWECFH